MGKGQKGKGSVNHKPNNKFKQRTPQNKKQLAKVDRILQGGRSQSKNHSKDRQGKFSKKTKDQSKGKGRQFSSQKRNSSKQGRKNNDWSQKNDRKTKSISKDRIVNKQKKNRFQEQKQEKGQTVLKGKPLFKIIAENDDDQFAALGGDQSQQSQQNDNENEQFQQEGQGQQFEDQQQQEQDQNDDQLDEEGIQDQQDIDNQDEQDDQLLEQQIEDHEVDQQGGQQNQNGEQQVDIDNQQQANQQEQGAEQDQNNNDNEPVDISVINLKIQQTIQILMNVQKLGGGKPRKHFIEELKNLIHRYYGYNFELISHFLDFLNPAEMIQFFQANETQRPLTIRTNTLKTRRKQLAQSLIQRGVNLDPLADWSKVGIKIYDTKVPIGATPQYLAGHYMLQSASSLLPVMALDPQVGQKILDMASAPGGKTTYIAQLMKNTGCIFANDLKKERLRALQFNLYRLGVTNTAVTCRDGRKFPAIFPATFDRVLLDAPCTGLGIISKDHSIKANRLLIDIYKNSHLQKQLLLAAIDCCKVNGVVVYSTCSVSPLQNEQVVNYALKRRFIKIVDCNVDVGEEGLTKFVEKRFHVDLKKTRRIYPHVHNMDGFYVAKLVKVSKGKKQVKQDEEQKQQGKVMQEEINEEMNQ